MTPKNHQTKVIWFTGLSGSGKSTLADKLYMVLKKKFKTLRVDGDIIRKKTKKKNLAVLKLLKIIFLLLI